AICLRVTRVVEHALFWDTAQTAEEEKKEIGPVRYHYVRFARHEQGDVLIVGGEITRRGRLRIARSVSSIWNGGRAPASHLSRRSLTAGPVKSWNLWMGGVYRLQPRRQERLCSYR